MKSAGNVADADGWDAAVAAADPAVLRMALLDTGQNIQLEAMKVVERPIRGGAMTVATLAPDDQRLVRQIAANPVPPARSDGSSRSAYPLDHLLAFAGSATPTVAALRLAEDELTAGAAGQLCNAPLPKEVARENLTVVIGAGISGIAAATHLLALGLPVIVIERSSDVGGTWRWNNYPGARVDVPTPVYQFQSQRYDWQRPFARQPEILSYLQAAVTERSVHEHIRFNTELVDAVWDEPTSLWRLALSHADGTTSSLDARFVISAVGLFNRAKVPDIPGLSTFDGPVLHTTDWNDDVNFRGARVALIGTGSSGAQLLPMLARDASVLTVFQRTPNWVMPLPDFDAEYPQGLMKLQTRLPAYARWTRQAALRIDRQIEPLQERDPKWIAAGGRVNERNDALASYLTRHIHARFEGRPDLIKASLPAYPPASRRLVVDNGWYDALLRPNVRLCTDAVHSIAGNMIWTAADEAVLADVLVIASGFAVDEYLFPVNYSGRNGQTLRNLWSADGARAFLGMTMPGFPNLLAFYGPNGQPRSGGFHAWAERWGRYAARIVEHTIERGARSFDVTRDRYDAYNRGMDLAMDRLVWGEGGAGSYYFNTAGRSAINMPWRAEEYFEMVSNPDLTAYRFQ